MNSGSHGLRNYIIRRLLLMIPTLLGVTLVVFVLCQFVPGGPMDQLRMQLAGMSDAGSGGGDGGGKGSGGATKSGGVVVSERDLSALSAYYGFDKPVPVRYVRYLGQLVTLDLGTSFRFSEPVTEIIKRRLPVSLWYGLITTILVYTICIPLGIVKAINHRNIIDYGTSLLIFLGYAIPAFALGALMLALFAVKLNWFPIGGFKSENFADLSLFGKFKDLLHHSILPLVCYMIGSLATMTLMMKNSLMENMSADYVKTALAAGATWRRAIFVHALRNSLVPIATTFGHNISLVLTGSLLIERIFNIQGMGLLFFESMLARDYPIVMGITVIGAFLLLLGNLLSDLCVAAVDPRVRFQ